MCRFGPNMCSTTLLWISQSASSFAMDLEGAGQEESEAFRGAHTHTDRTTDTFVRGDVRFRVGHQRLVVADVIEGVQLVLRRDTDVSM